MTCGEPKPLSEFGKRAREPDGINRTCKRCRAKIDRKSYISNPKRRLAIDADRKAARERNRDYVRAYLEAHPCVDCSEADLVVLEFDHRGDKVADVGRMIREGWALWRLVKEIAKCDVRCANCHRRKTAERHGGWWRVLGC